MALPFSLSPAPTERINAKTREAVRLMVEEAISRPEAAQIAGLTDQGLANALRKPTVIAYRTRLFEALRTSEAARTVGRAAKLADKAESEHVRLQANTWLAGIEGISPVVKSESTSTHRHLHAGLVIVRGAEPVIDEPARVIDGQAREVQTRKSINRIGKPVPHPSMRNADHHGPIEVAPAAGGEGQK